MAAPDDAECPEVLVDANEGKKSRGQDLASMEYLSTEPRYVKDSSSVARRIASGQTECEGASAGGGSSTTSTTETEGNGNDKRSVCLE
jgi:hypothetical protein